MNTRKLLLFGLLGLMLVMGGVTAAVMLSSTSYMNGAADYAKAHLAQLPPPPEPLPGATPWDESPVRVELEARYGDANAVEVQITRRYKTAQHPEDQFYTTYFYQPTADGWQLIPPPASFWGDQTTTAGTRITLVSPQRNQTMINDLIAVIDPALASACTQWNCPTDLTPIQLTFTVVPGAPTNNVTFAAPQYTGVPLTYTANVDFQSALTVDSIRLLAAELGKSDAEASAEINRQNLYAGP